jgi:hypothetical protein
MPRPRPFALKIRDHLEHQGCEVFDCGQEGMGWFVAFAPAAAHDDADLSHLFILTDRGVVALWKQVQQVRRA